MVTKNMVRKIIVRHAQCHTLLKSIGMRLKFNRMGG